MEVLLLPGKPTRLVQIICDTVEQTRIVAGLCMDSNINGWQRYNNVFILPWKVYQHIAANGLLNIYLKNYAECIREEHYDQEWPDLEIA